MTPTPRTAQEIADLLLARDPLPPLVPTQVFDAALTAEIEAADASDLVKVGLHLLNDDLAASHTLAQVHEGEPLADYWHAIIHRREGDYGNSRYWFGRVGCAPILAGFYGSYPGGPADFVEQCRRTGAGEDEVLQQIQQDEMDYVLAQAQGQSA
jgi:hypothetical protein